MDTSASGLAGKTNRDSANPSYSSVSSSSSFGSMGAGRGALSPGVGSGLVLAQQEGMKVGSGTLLSPGIEPVIEAPRPCHTSASAATSPATVPSTGPLEARRLSGVGAPLGEVQGWADRGGTGGLRGLPPRRPSSSGIHSEGFQHNLSSSRESCV
ncbi:uncharacterized protein LOC123502726 [Portunus trituberculatus]|uniref:uncharacterized protein LOC123502726 n=1 Tax=Portunus trituberculatus TaxID=210409 RepID=UPI001E1CBB4B|nr:uncharacterized protein LOC123502726 [Portunus trituberculatus]